MTGMTFGPLSTVHYEVNGVSFDMVRVPPGRFVEGAGLYAREQLISRPFEIGITSVSPVLYNALMVPSRTGDRRYRTDGAVDLTWEDANELCEALVAEGFAGFRLPSEAEWAWAARCGLPTGHAGADRPSAVAATYPLTTPPVLASRRVCAVGAFDMSGGWFDWVADKQQDLGRASGVDVVDLRGESPQRPQKGGSWILGPGASKLNRRYANRPELAWAGFGFRLARQIEHAAGARGGGR